MQHLGGFIFGRALSIAFPRSSCAGFIMGVWKAPPALMTRACKARDFVASSQSLLMVVLLPPQVKPEGNRTFAIWHTGSLTSFSAAFASLQSFSSVGLSRPATEHMHCAAASVASCIASARSLTSFKQSSKSRTPATQMAVYSPKLRPATACGLSTTSFLVSRSCSTAAKPAMNIAGWQYLVSLSLSSGPFKQSSFTSHPRIFSAFSSISFTAGNPMTSFIMPTF
mmetsp:Transcript_17898/g.56772  ORF Transcript_17898/g.56772 Transcript_17898/m.56772 type:complete len:225 (+) Transcript_17898:332-1006(+)